MTEDSVIAQSVDCLDRVRHEITKCVVGQSGVIDQALICLVAAGHALVEGVPGLGKTLLVRALTAAVGGEFNRVQFTPDLMPSDLVGHTMFDVGEQTWIVRRGPVFCNFLLADEINRAPAKTQSALLEVMQEQQVTIDGTTHTLGQPFVVFATQNPVEHEGTYPLPEAQLDRFLLNVRIAYPSVEEEVGIVRHLTQGSVGDKLDLSSVSAVLSPTHVQALQKTAAGLLIDDKIYDYAVRIVASTRNWNGIEVGASPRASIALLRAARAKALLSGNHFVTPDDVKSIATAVLRHRLRLTADYEIEGYSVDRVLADILDDIAAPRL